MTESILSTYSNRFVQAVNAFKSNLCLKKQQSKAIVPANRLFSTFQNVFTKHTRIESKRNVCRTIMLPSALTQVTKSLQTGVVAGTAFFGAATAALLCADSYRSTIRNLDWDALAAVGVALTGVVSSVKTFRDLSQTIDKKSGQIESTSTLSKLASSVQAGVVTSLTAIGACWVVGTASKNLQHDTLLLVSSGALLSGLGASVRKLSEFSSPNAATQEQVATDQNRKVLSKIVASIGAGVLGAASTFGCSVAAAISYTQLTGHLLSERQTFPLILAGSSLAGLLWGVRKYKTFRPKDENITTTPLIKTTRLSIAQHGRLSKVLKSFREGVLAGAATFGAAAGATILAEEARWIHRQEADSMLAVGVGVAILATFGEALREYYALSKLNLKQAEAQKNTLLNKVTKSVGTGILASTVSAALCRGFADAYKMLTGDLISYSFSGVSPSHVVSGIAFSGLYAAARKYQAYNQSMNEDKHLALSEQKNQQLLTKERTTLITAAIAAWVGSQIV